jgi:hypothetical protein
LQSQAQEKPAVSSGFPSGAYRDRTGDLRLAKPRERENGRNRARPGKDANRMVTGIRPGRPRNRADRGFGEIQSFWRFSGVQSSALTTLADLTERASSTGDLEGKPSVELGPGLGAVVTESCAR